jgi:hypothetical protein
VLTNIIPATGFTVATTAPAMLGSPLDLLHFLGQHLVWFGGTLTGIALLMVVWGSAHESARQESIAAADEQWERTGLAVPGWGPGWFWSARPGQEDATPATAVEALDAALVAEEPVEIRAFRPPAAVRSAICASCKGALASTTVRYSDGTEFRVCGRCAPAGVELDAHVPTTFGRAS